MLRYERGKRPIVKGAQLVVPRHDLAGVPTRLHIDEVLAVGEKAPHLHFVQEFAEQLGRRWQRRERHQARDIRQPSNSP
jgi:hypothetical protein